MAQEHDLFDDIIEISKGLDFFKDPLGGVTDALDPSAPQWNPADYKERPRGNTIPCLTCKNEKSGCTACMDVCPVNAIEVEEDAIEILDSCRKCGLCAAACPTEAIISPRLAPKNLYDDIVSAATSHETAYVTCTRALKRMPRENEVVVACVGDITAETWFSVLADYPNVSVYLPLGVCDKCRNIGKNGSYSHYEYKQDHSVLKLVSADKQHNSLTDTDSPGSAGSYKSDYPCKHKSSRQSGKLTKRC